MTVIKDTRELGKVAIDSAIKLANEETVDVNGMVNNNKIDVPSILITPIYIDKIIVDTGYYKNEEVYNRYY